MHKGNVNFSCQLQSCLEPIPIPFYSSWQALRYDEFFLSMLATSVVIVAINWKRYHSCTYPLHIWIVVDYTAVFVFRLLMFVDNGFAAGMSLDFGWQQRYARFCGRVVVLSILALLLYPFLWSWTIVGTMWFSSAKSCLPEEGQKWEFLIWLLFSYCGLLCIACMSVGKPKLSPRREKIIGLVNLCANEASV
ncbi:unnamed protein product [Trifolium pratense]|uniref:Uncharacterized protein n=1 Tax=Trifolium pratense TaxID=57577 RepID=A0ACB0L067_TRIPR|nr:unnamed protein product [Trifolium pratense]